MRLLISVFVAFLIGTSFGYSQTTPAQEGCFDLPVSLVKNNDDLLTIKSKCDISEFNFQLFNRWGQMIFESQKPGEQSDLKINAAEKGREIFPSGTYFWTIKYKKIDSNEEVSITGFLNIL